jgi:hypothetical protein
LPGGTAAAFPRASIRPANTAKFPLKFMLSPR